MCNIVLGVSKASCVVVPKAAGIGLGLLCSFPGSDASGTVCVLGGGGEGRGVGVHSKGRSSLFLEIFQTIESSFPCGP